MRNQPGSEPLCFAKGRWYGPPLSRHILLPGIRGFGRLRIVHVIATSKHDSMGVTTALREIVAAQAAEGLDVCLLVNGGWPGSVDPRVQLVECRRRALPVQLARLAGERGVVHSHVPWRLPALSPLLIGKRARTFVHSPHGSFAPDAWAINRGRKRLAWTLFGRAIRRNDLIVVNSAAEEVEVDAMGMGIPIVRIPHPITVPAVPARGAGMRRTVAFLGRIHPIKGLLELVQAWAALGDTTADWKLSIVGPPEVPEYAAQVRAAAARCRNIDWAPALFGDDRWGFLANADVVAVPSRSENFCYVVAEALAMRTPVLTTTGVPWAEIETLGLGWRDEGSVNGLAAMLARAIAADPADRIAMGARGRAYVEAEFGARSVARRYVDAYERALER